MSNSISDDTLAQYILYVLQEAEKPLLAREIAARISSKSGIIIRRKHVNSRLYGNSLRSLVIQDSDYRWVLRDNEKQKYNRMRSRINKDVPSPQPLAKPKDDVKPLKPTHLRNQPQSSSAFLKTGDNSISVERVCKDSRCDFIESEISGPFVFDIQNCNGHTDVILNITHPLNKDAGGLLTSHDGENDNPALRTLKILLRAWAQLEDNAEGQHRQALQDARLDWGRIARDLIQEADD